DRSRLDTGQRAALVNLLCDTGLIHRSLKEYDAAARIGREAVLRSAGLPNNIRGRALNEMAITLGQMGDLQGSIGALEGTLPVARENAQRDPSWENRRRVASTLTN